MYKLFILAVGLLISQYAAAQDQQDNEQRILLDSIQRNYLVDSLSLTGDQVKQVFTLRQEYFDAFARAVQNEEFTKNDLRERLAELKEKLHRDMEALLGRDVYTRYVQTIKSRFGNRGVKIERSALAN